MQLLPMDAPAVIHRRPYAGAATQIVARGPLIIMAHGLMALDPVGQERCWITYAAGDLYPGDAAEALRRWSERPPLALAQ